MKLEWAPTVYRQLNGVFCVYKPANLNSYQLVDALKFNIVKGLNSLPCYKHEFKKDQVCSNSKSSLPAVNAVPVDLTDLTDHRLVLGPRYIMSDIPLKSNVSLARHSSGVQVVGIQRGISTINVMNSCQFLRVYHIKGQFGMVTEDFSPRGRLLQKISYSHLNKTMLDRVCAHAEAQHQKQMFTYAKLDPQSQEAYELASQGLVRPSDKKVPTILYGVKCIDFNLPNFTLEVHTINERTSYLMCLVHDLGLQLKSGAVCTQVRCIRDGHFTLEHALLRKFWTLTDILENIKVCRQLTTPDKLVASTLLQDPTELDDEKFLYLPEDNGLVAKE